MHVRPVTFPRDLAGAKNGFILGEYLTPTRGGDSLHHLAARAFDAMHAKAEAHGIELAMTDGYRPYETQERLFRERYSTVWRPGAPSKKWHGTTWWKRYGVATAATPGTSNHGWGLATDIADATGERLLWLDEYAADYGFSWELLPEEPWHLRYINGDALPAAVLLHEASSKPPRFPDMEALLMASSPFQLIGGNVYTFVPGQRAVSMGGLGNVHSCLHASGVAPVAGNVPADELEEFVKRWDSAVA